MKKYGGARGLLKDFKKEKYQYYVHSQVRGRMDDLPFKILLAEGGEIHGEIEVIDLGEPSSKDLRQFPYARRIYMAKNQGTCLYPEGAITYQDLDSLPSFQKTKFPHSRIRYAPKLPDEEYATLTAGIRCV